MALVKLSCVISYMKIHVATPLMSTQMSQHELRRLVETEPCKISAFYESVANHGICKRRNKLLIDRKKL